MTKSNVNYSPIMCFFIVLLPPYSLHKRCWILHMCHIHVHILRLASIWTFSRWSEALLHNNKPQAFLSDLALNWAQKLFGCYFYHGRAQNQRHSLPSPCGFTLAHGSMKLFCLRLPSFNNILHFFVAFFPLIMFLHQKQ